MDWLSWIPGYTFLANMSSNIVIIALVGAGLYLMPTGKRLIDPLITKIGEYLPGITDYLAEGAKGLKILGAASVVLLGLSHLSVYYVGKYSAPGCKAAVEANMQDLRSKFRFVPK